MDVGAVQMRIYEVVKPYDNAIFKLSGTIKFEQWFWFESFH